MTPEVMSTVESSFWRRPKNLEKNPKARDNILLHLNSSLNCISYAI